LDRLTHHAHILLFQGAESYRFRHSRARQPKEVPPPATDNP